MTDWRQKWPWCMTFGNPVPGLGQAQKYIEYIEILNSITCGKQLHDCIFSLRGKVWAQKTIWCACTKPEMWAVMYLCVRGEQDNSPPDNSPTRIIAPHKFFSVLYLVSDYPFLTLWIPLDYYTFTSKYTPFKPVLSLYLACNHFFSKFFLIINLCT